MAYRSSVSIVKNIDGDLSGSNLDAEMKLFKSRGFLCELMFSVDVNTPKMIISKLGYGFNVFIKNILTDHNQIFAYSKTTGRDIVIVERFVDKFVVTIIYIRGKRKATEDISNRPVKKANLSK